jgi:cytidine deaminase
VADPTPQHRLFQIRTLLRHAGNCISLHSSLYSRTPTGESSPSSESRALTTHAHNPYRDLLKAAASAKKLAVAPYSRFHVGAALLTAQGRVYTGCNIESSSYSLTICAERTAIFKAISEGERSFRAIAVVSDDPGFTPPCGACRQVLLDLAGNIDFIMMNARGRVKVLRLKELLPEAFGSKNLRRSTSRK